MAAADLSSITATKAAAEIARGALSARDYATACLDRIAAVEPQIGAFTHLDPDHVLAQARALDESRAQGKPVGPLHGIPVGIKDIIDTADYPTENGSPFFAGRRPLRDATLVARLRAAGAIIVGKTVTTECAYFHPGKTRNPHDVTRTPGGSSSGSAAAVAAGMVPLAIGTQTNGSIIRPGAFCGTYAIKPSHGLVSRAGILPLSRSLDHPGPFARSLEDIALILGVIAGYDPADPDTRPVASPDYSAVESEKFPLTPRFAFVKTQAWDKADEPTRTAFEQLAAKLGDACFALDLPDRYAAAWPAQRAVMAVEMAHNLGAFTDRGGDVFSKVLRDLLEEGRRVTATRYLAALAEARSFTAGFADIFEQCNAIITPATTGIAPDIATTGNPAFCSLWSLTGLPAITLPLLEGEHGMPLGVQVIGPMGDDARLLRTAAWLVKKLAAGPPARRAATVG